MARAKSDTKHTTRELEVVLTDAARIELAEQIADLSTDIARIRGHMLDSKARLKELEDERAQLAKTRSAGVEIRSVACTVTLQGTTLTVTRDDTGEVVEQRPASDAERQGELLA